MSVRLETAKRLVASAAKGAERDQEKADKRWGEALERAEAREAEYKAAREDAAKLEAAAAALEG